jgi:hypothetical protein
MRRALVIDEASLGPDHPIVAMRLNRPPAAFEANQLVDPRAKQTAKFYTAVWADWCHLQLNR